MNKLEELHKIFSNINDWLKFAEAKNAVLIGFISTILGFAFSSLSNLPQDFHAIVKFIFLPTEILALLIPLASFFPPFEFHFSDKNRNKNNDNKKSNKKNIFYFEYLKNINLKNLLNYFEINISDKEDNLEQKICRDLIDQIITNSKITSRKLKLFNYGGLFFLLGVLISTIIYLLKIFFNT